MIQSHHKQKHSKYSTNSTWTRFFLTVCLSLFVSLSLSGTAAAKDICDNLADSPEWTDNLTEFFNAIQTDDLTRAKSLSQQLADICPNSPTLNYAQGKMYEKLHDKANALYYYQKASENTYTYAVNPQTAQKIWYARYEFEHPERTADALNTLQAQSEQHLDAFSAYKEEHFKEISRLLWTGTGVAAGGLALISAGAALVAINPISITKGDNAPDEYHEKPTYAIGWAAIGVGAGLLISGTVLAGIYGYKYTHFETENVDISFSLTPTSLSFGLSF